MQPFDVGLSQTEGSELCCHLFPTGVCRAKARTNVAAAQRDHTEDPKLHENRDVECANAIDDRHREVKHVAEHRDEQHSGRRQQQRADGNHQDVERSELRRSSSLGHVHDRRDQ